jgi:hypothetical protein
LEALATNACGAGTRLSEAAIAAVLPHFCRSGASMLQWIATSIFGRLSPTGREKS